MYIYAVSGSLIANGVLSSCFSQVESHSVQKVAFDLLVAIYRYFFIALYAQMRCFIIYVSFRVFGFLTGWNTFI
jgi:hypothetical protein